MSRHKVAMKAVVAFCKNLGIGSGGKILWKIPEDVDNFRRLTNGSIIIMGYKTYLSIPNHPLKNRINIVIKNNLTSAEEATSQYNYTTPYYTSDTERAVSIAQFLSKLHGKEIFVIGGEQIYRKLINQCDIIYATHIDKAYSSDRIFPLTNEFELTSYSPQYWSSTEQCHYRYLTYVKRSQSEEYQYTNLLKTIFNVGSKRVDRTGVGTLAVFGERLQFSLSGTLPNEIRLPLLTTKFVPYKMILKELLWFIRGQTDNRTLQEQGVHIWDGNTSSEFLERRGLNYIEGDIGPNYGWQWRHFGAKYIGCTADYTGEGIDQLMNVINLIKSDPHSRRIMMTTYNVADVDKCVLHPCHGIITQFYVNDGGLECHMYQRSVDCGCGLPFNIASYAFLTQIIAMKTGLQATRLVISTGDTHIYNTHIEALKKQAELEPYQFPLCKYIGDTDKDIEDISVEDFDVIGYIHHPPIKLEMSI